MANVLGAYNQVFYAQQALIHLRKELGMASRVYLAMDDDRRVRNRGETITVRRPSTFTAQSAPSSAQDLNTEYVTVTLDQWQEVKFKITDKELAFTGEQIIQDHIEPAAYALADAMDQSLADLYKQIPWLYDYGTATNSSIITGARQVGRSINMPLDNRAVSNVHFMVDGTVEGYFLNDSLFHSSQIVGGTQISQETLLRGGLGTRFGVENFVNQNTPTHTPGTAAAAGGDGAGALNGAVAIGATSAAVDGFTGSETLVEGDTFVIAGNTQRYAVTANVTFSTGAGTISFFPAAAQAYADNAVVTVTQQTATAHSQQLLFHRDAFAIVTAQLPTNLPGIDVFAAFDPVTGLALRARRFADGDTSTVYQAIDALWGVKTLNANLGVRAWT